jgi:acetoin utilization deacetylase AcuC-like enzyme
LRTIHEVLDKNPIDGLIPIAAQPARVEDLELVHTPTYVKKVLKTADQTFTNLAPDTPASAKSYLAAWLAVGGCLQALVALMAGRCQACFCLVRPPGHHALEDRAGGFCIFNNLAVTARYAAQHHGIQRTLIIDYDIHHGNGLQGIFYSDPSVFYFSTHDPLLYPYTGAMDEVGDHNGKGYTVNIPVARPFGDAEMLYLYQELLPGVIRGFQPQLVLLAAGFDALEADPIGRCQVTPQGFADLTRLLKASLAAEGNPPLLLALEGGYHVRNLADTVRGVIAALAEPGTQPPPEAASTPETEALTAQVLGMHKPHGVWVD